MNQAAMLFSRAALALVLLLGAGCDCREGAVTFPDTPLAGPDAPQIAADVAPQTLDALPDVVPDAPSAPKGASKSRVPRPAGSPEPQPAGDSGEAIASLGKVTMSGGLAKPAVDRFLRSRLGALRACYERELTTNPKLRGRVTMELTVAPSGSVTVGVVQSSTLASGETEMCMAQASQNFRFPPSPGPGDATVVFPVDLRRAGP